MSTKSSPLPDLLYILGTGSRWQDNEIRYSLRSAQKNFPHRRVVVVGEHPSWMCNIKHIGCKDHYGDKKLKNSIYKLATALRDPHLSQQFVLMNDDFFFMKPVDIVEPACKGLLSTTLGKHPTRDGYYYMAMKAAYIRLLDYGIAQPKDFGMHVPIMLDKAKARKTMELFGGAGHGYLFRTMYGNLWHDDAPRMVDKKLKAFPKDTSTIARLTYLSTDPTVVLEGAFQKWIQAKFPTPSRYERR
jgi:hypothetical protein